MTLSQTQAWTLTAIYLAAIVVWTVVAMRQFLRGEWHAPTMVFAYVLAMAGFTASVTGVLNVS
jgi:hypothetical protein